MEMKKYITPEVEIFELKIHQPLLDASVDEGGSGVIGGDEPVTPDPGFGPA